MKKDLFNVTGMSCAACVGHVEKAVKKVNGVKEVNVNLLSNNMTVEYDENTCIAGQIEKSVKDAGYGAKVVGKNKSESGDKNDYSDDIKAQNKKKFIELIVSGILLIALMYFSMGNMMWGFPSPDVFDHHKNTVGFALIQFILLLPILYIYRRYFISGYKKLFRGAPNMDTLVAIGSTASVVYGIAAMFIMSNATAKIAMGGLTEEQIAGYRSIIATYHHNLYFESAGMILTLVSLGKYLEGLSKQKTTKAVEALASLAPKRAVVLVNGEEKEIAAEEVKAGDTVVVRKGEIIPVDGELLSGGISVDQSNITGESIPVSKTVGQAVYASTTVTAGYCTIKSTKVGEDTSFSNIVRLVEEAANSKAPVSRLADKVSGVFVPTVLIIGLLTFIINMLVGASFELALNFAVTVVVIACPCALGLATPVAIMAGTGKGAELGLIIKNAEILERTKSINVVVFDKTGTITQGKPSVTDFLTSGDQEQILNYVYSVENMSEHPLAHAVCEYAKDKNARIFDVDNYKSLEGRGISGDINGENVAIGNYAFARELSDNAGEFLSRADEFGQQGKTSLYVIINGKTVALISIKDQVKESAVSAVNQLIARDIETIMLTGDNEKTAKAIAKEVGISTVYAEVLPQEKQSVVEKLKKDGKVIAMVGDGVNDSPALTAADIGIAIGGGSDVAVNSGDIVLLKNDLAGVYQAVDLSKFVLKKIKMGLFWAFFYNAVCVFIATGIPYYIWGFKISPMIGALAMSFSSVSVVLNALTINLFKPKTIKNKKHNADAVTVDNGKNLTNNTINAALTAENKTSDNKGDNVMKTVIKVNGMMCGHCVMHVENAAKSVDGVLSAKADLANKEVVIEHNGADIELIKQKIKDAGYEVK